MASPQWKLVDIQSELKAMETLLQARPTLEQDKDRLVQQLGYKLQSLQLAGPEEGAQLYQAVQQAKLPQSVVQKLLEIVDQLVLGSATAGVHSLCTKPQCVKELAKYLTAQEVQALAHQDMWSGAVVLGKRLKLLGLTSLKETTKKVATALLVLHEWKRTSKVPTKDAVYVLAQHVKTAFAQAPMAPAGAQTLQTYPLDPLALPFDHLKASYGADRPALTVFPELALMLNYTKVRKTGLDKPQARCVDTYCALSLIPSISILLQLLAKCKSDTDHTHSFIHSFQKSLMHVLSHLGALLFHLLNTIAT